jgi:hypothetical protein
MRTTSLQAGLKISRVFCAWVLAVSFFASPALAEPDPDGSELLRSFQKVDVWHFPVDYDVGYNNQDVLVSRVLVPQPGPPGELCYIRFDLVRGEGDYAYGFKPPELGPSKPGEWGVWVKQRGTVLNQQRCILKMNVVYFYVEGPKNADAKDLCVRKQAAPTSQAGHGYSAKDWSSLIVRGRLIHGWPQSSQ